MHTCVTRLRSALSPGLLQNGPEEELWKIWGGPASPGDILVKVVGCTKSGWAIPELRPFNQQLGTLFLKHQLLGMCKAGLVTHETDLWSTELTCSTVMLVVSSVPCSG